MNYRKALEQAIMYIENHLDEDIKVEDVASYAGYSYYHFNRQFTAILGESVGSYIKKRRLANAAQKLLYTDNKIIDIAIENSFESAEAFSRAFKSMYKISPQSYRKNRIHTFVSVKERLDNSLLDHLINHVSVHPKIVQLSEIKIIGIRKKTEIQVHKIKEFWEEFYSLIKQIPSINSRSRKIGLYESNDEDIYFSINGEMKYNEIMGVEVSSFEDIPNGFINKVVVGGRYAVFTHHGSLKTLPQTIDYIWGTWLLSTKEEIDSREIFEVYDNRFLGYDNRESQIDIYIPIR